MFNCTVNSVKVKLLLLLLLPAFICQAQKTSPWKKLKDQTISGVFMGLGRHEYSLTEGQGFSVYLKNYSGAPVVVSGKVVAKTICGNEVVTNFVTTLQVNQESSGGNFTDTSNSQTGVVTKQDCIGKKHYISAKYAVTNRIQDVYLKDIQVQSLGEAPSAPTPNIPVAAPPPIQQTIVVPKPVLNLDSIYNLHVKDSMAYRIDSLKARNLYLQQALDMANKKSLAADSILKAGAMNMKKKPKKDSGAYTFTPYAGLGFDQLPIVTNQDSISGISPKSRTNTSAHPLAEVGFDLGLFNHSLFSLDINGFGSYGFNVGSVTGHHATYGGLADLLLRCNNSGSVHFFLEGGYIGRNGTWSKDVDVANPLVANTVVKTTQVSNYQYGFSHIGVGLKYQWNKGLSFVKGSISSENTSTFTAGTSPAYLLNLKFQLNGKWVLGLSYATNYFMTEKVKYPANFVNTSQNYMGVRLLYNIKSWSL